MLNFLAVLLLTSLSLAHAETISGQCQIQVVQPIYETQRISHTCYETHYDTCNCDDQGCQSCSSEVSYDCSSDETVRIGSKPLNTLLVTASLTTIKVGENAKDGKYAVGAKCKTHIDKGFDAKGLAEAVISSESPLINQKITAMDNDTITISAETVEVDQAELTAYFRTLEIPTKDEIVFPPLKNLKYIYAQLCVGKDPLLSSQIKWFGCNQVSPLVAGTLKLTQYNLNQTTRREWVYWFQVWTGRAYDNVYLRKQW